MLYSLVALALVIAAGGAPARASAADPVEAGSRLPVLAQAPGDQLPPDDGGEDEGDEVQVFPPDSTLVPTDTVKVAPASPQGVKPAAPDTLRAGTPAPGIPQPGAAAADSLQRAGAPADSLHRAAPPAAGKPPGAVGPGQPPRPGTAPPPPKPAERKGVFGLHPLLIVAGLVVAHVLIVGAATN